MQLDPFYLNYLERVGVSHWTPMVISKEKLNSTKYVGYSPTDEMQAWLRVHVSPAQHMLIHDNGWFWDIIEVDNDKDHDLCLFFFEKPENALQFKLTFG